MLRNALGSLVLSGLLVAPALAQAPNGTAKKPLDHEAYDIWNRISTEAISDDGRFVLFVRSSEANDPRLFVKDAATGTTLHEIVRGDDARFTEDARFVVFKLKPAKAAVEAAEEAEKKEDEMPRDSLGILDLTTGATARIANVATFALPEDAGGWLAYHHGKAPASPDSAKADSARAPGVMPEPPVAPAGERPRPEQDEDEEEREDGTTLVVRNLATGDERRIDFVHEYVFSKDGAHLAYTAISLDGTADGAFVLETATGNTVPLLAGKGDYESLTFDEAGEKLAFHSNRDDFAAEQPAFALYVWDGGDAARLIADGANAAIPAGWWISDNGDVNFSENGERLFFGTAPRPEPETPDSLKPPEDERVVVDVWAWTDPYLQPHQLEQLEEERDRTYTAIVHLEDNRIVQLGSLEMPEVMLADDGDAAILIGRSNLPYRQQVSWGERGNDYYVVDPETGQRELVVEYVNGNANLSPGGKYIAWFDGEQLQWFVMDVASQETINVSEGITQPLQDELHDAPSLPDAYGSAGWTEDDALFLVYDRYDIWAVDPTGNDEPRNITEGVGRRENLRFRYVDVNESGGGGRFGGGGARDDAIDPAEPMLLSAFDSWNKTDGFYRDRIDGAAEPARLVMLDKSLGSPRKAEDADVLLLTRASFQEFPDLYVTGPDFREFRRMSDANPQQAEYRWGTSELVQWRSVSGEQLQGVLYKPEGFDPSQQYPMMVYFYERLSDRLNNYVIPDAGSSSINISFYVSRGYLV
ncbi:MAG: TolB family protein, partial [Longimicrobiales bacterium]